LDSGLVEQLRREARRQQTSVSDLIGELLLDTAPLVLAASAWAYAARNADRRRTHGNNHMSSITGDDPGLAPEVIETRPSRGSTSVSRLTPGRRPIGTLAGDGPP
jgi:hypothetical protein